MSTGNPKDKLNRRSRVRATVRTPDPDSQLLARIRRHIANFLPEKAKGSAECSDADSKPLTVSEQIYVQLQLERLDRYGFYQQPRRHRNIEPLDQLLGPARKEAKDAEVRKPLGPIHTSSSMNTGFAALQPWSCPEQFPNSRQIKQGDRLDSRTKDFQKQSCPGRDQRNRAHPDGRSRWAFRRGTIVIHMIER
jgi:hypothetical protein